MKTLLLKNDDLHSRRCMPERADEMWRLAWNPSFSVWNLSTLAYLWLILAYFGLFLTDFGLFWRRFNTGRCTKTIIFSIQNHHSLLCLGVNLVYLGVNLACSGVNLVYFDAAKWDADSYEPAAYTDWVCWAGRAVAPVPRGQHLKLIISSINSSFWGWIPSLLVWIST